MSEPYGTVRWFGPSWDAPVCDPANEIEVPVGQDCVVCHRQIGPGVPGLRVPFWDGGGEVGFAYYHHQHFLEMVGIRT